MNIIKVNADRDQIRTVIPEQLHGWLIPSMGGATELIMYAAMEGDDVLGFILYGKTKEYDQGYQIIYITVEEQRRDQGIASELIRVTSGYLRKNGARMIILSEGPEGLKGRFLLDGNVKYDEKNSATLYYTVGAVKEAAICDSLHKMEPLLKCIKSKEEITDKGMIAQFEKDTHKNGRKINFDEVDSDYSCFWVSDDRIVAYMIITDMSDGFFFVKSMEILHKNESTQFAIPIMMAYFVRKSMENCPNDTIFGINIIKPNLIEPTRKYLGDPEAIMEYTDYHLG